MREVRQYIATSKILHLLTPPKLYTYISTSSNNTYNLDNDFRCLSLLVSMAVISFTSRYNSEVSRGIPTKKRIVFFFVWVYVDASFNNYTHVPLCSKMRENVHDYLNFFSKNRCFYKHFLIFSHSVTLVKNIFLTLILSPISVQLNF